MFSAIFNNFSAILLAVNLFCFVICNDNEDSKEMDENVNSGLWFGPRLGKRSSRIGDDNRQTMLRLLEAADALKYYYDQLQYIDPRIEEEPREVLSKKVIFTPKLGRSVTDDKRYESVDFTPRLGRRLADDMPATPPVNHNYRQDPVQINSRSQYFSPRLGRTMNFSPRLGRELSYDLFPEKIRVVRSTNKTRAT